MKPELEPEEMNDARDFQEEYSSEQSSTTSCGCGCTQCNSIGPGSCRASGKEVEK